MTQPQPVFYSSLNTPVSEIFVAKTAQGLVRVSYLDAHWQLSDELRELAGRLEGELIEDAGEFTELREQLDQYFSGERQQFTIPLDLQLVDGFHVKVLEQVRNIPYAETASYREMAIRAGSPNAYRAAGSACKHNPLILMIPCHRVVKADGSLGEYGTAGTWRKQFLIDLELAVRL